MARRANGRGITRIMSRCCLVAILARLCMCGVAMAEEDSLRLARFDVDVTPPIGVRMAYDTAARAADLPLRCCGIVILGAGEPMVLAAIDWIGIGNAAHDAFRDALAHAAGTSPERVAIQSLHQHDAPQADFTAEKLLADMGVTTYRRFDGGFAREIISRTATAITASLASAVPITHVGFGRGKVDEVASNRRLLGQDGKVRGWRASTTRDASLRAEPEGLIDPFVAALVFWSDADPVVVLTSYATHPMSYYRTGVPGPDFPGIARLLRSQDVPSALHVHFTGAGGNVAAGKYNDGSHSNRVTFALRLAAGMRSAFDAAVGDRHPIDADAVGWSSVPVRLESRPELESAALTAAIRTTVDRGTMNDADALAWVERCRTGPPIDVTCLRVDDVRMLHMPGELFVEYQLAAQAMRPDIHVMMAAYGDYGPGYIGTAAAYAQGGYEVETRSAFVGPEAEAALTEAMRTLLGAEPPPAPTGPADHSADLPRIAPVSSREAGETMRLAGGFSMTLAAAEPLLASPVAIDWDEDAALYVAEMRGYSENRDDRLGRIRRLIDDDRDGSFDRAGVFAEDLAWPTAVCCWDGGLFVADAPDIIFLRDTDGDGVADQRRRVFTGFGTGNVQGLVNSLRFGLDNRIHGSASSAGGDVRIVNDDSPVGQSVSLRGRDFSFDPRGLGRPDAAMDLRPETGGAQHGMSFDDHGNRYVCSNSDHAIRCMLDDRYLSRNPHFPAPSGRESIAAEGPQAEVFRASAVEPWRVLRTRLRASGVVPGIVEGGGRPAGYFTSATGITAVRGSSTGALRGMLVIGDVGSNLVHRKQIVPQGSGVRAERVDQAGELVASTDNWFRPVQFANGPDGSLWIVDMQREVIEHPDSLAPVIKRHLDLTSGRDSGRLWRLWHTDHPPSMPTALSSASTERLVPFLDHNNAWHRETAQRMLLGRDDPATIPLVRNLLAARTVGPLGRLHALWLLAGLGKLGIDDIEAALDDQSEAVRVAGLRLAEPFLVAETGDSRLAGRIAALSESEPSIAVRLQLALAAGFISDDGRRRATLSSLLARDGADQWCRIAAATSMRDDAGFIASEWLQDVRRLSSPVAEQVMPMMFTQIGRRGIDAEIQDALDRITTLARPPAPDATDHRDIATRLIVALRDALAATGRNVDRSRGSGSADDVLASLAAWNRDIAFDAKRPTTDRARAVRGAALDGIGHIAPLLDRAQPTEVVRMAVETIDRSSDPSADAILIDAIGSIPGDVRTLVTAALTRTASRGAALLSAIADGRIHDEALDRQGLESLRRFPDDDVRRRAEAILGGPPSADRRQLVTAYAASLPTAIGDPESGRSVFRRHCVSCHRVGGVGHDLGPNLAAMQARGPEAMLVGILDPNREVLPAFTARTVVGNDGRVVTGLLVTENAASLVLRLPEGDERTIPRDEIESVIDTGRSLMPEGFERSIEPRDMANLLAYIMSASAGAGPR